MYSQFSSSLIHLEFVLRGRPAIEWGFPVGPDLEGGGAANRDARGVNGEGGLEYFIHDAHAFRPPAPPLALYIFQVKWY